GDERLVGAPDAALDQAETGGDADQHQRNGVLAQDVDVVLPDGWAERGKANQQRQHQAGVEELGIGAAPGQRAEAVGDVDGADCGNGELERGQEGGELDQAEGRKAEDAAELKYELGAPNIFQTVGR